MLYGSITLLKNLEELSISCNVLPEGLLNNIFKSLQSLRDLDVAECKLTNLPNRCVLHYGII